MSDLVFVGAPAACPLAVGGTGGDLSAPIDAIRGAEQMAYLHYLLGALKGHDRLVRAREVVAESAALGVSGIDLPGDSTYTLRTIPGKEFSGRHLVSYL